jgi:hypothetical protein
MSEVLMQAGSRVTQFTLEIEENSVIIIVSLFWRRQPRPPIEQMSHAQQAISGIWSVNGGSRMIRYRGVATAFKGHSCMPLYHDTKIADFFIDCTAEQNRFQ